MKNLDELLDFDGILAECSHIASRRRLQAVMRGWGQAMLGISPKPPLQNAGWYFDSWDFPTRQAALKAMETWNSEESSEPTGWHRHAATGRFRIKGNEKLEYVKPSSFAKSVEQEVAYAVEVIQGRDRVVIEVRDDSDAANGIGHAYAEGTQFFTVISESSECTHAPKCQWYDRVFHWCGRYVVVAQRDLAITSVGNVIQRLTDPWPNP